MGKRKNRKNKKKNNKKKKNPITFKFIVIFIILVMIGIFAIIFAYKPFHDIPVLSEMVGDNYAYITPVMLFNQALPVIILLLGSFAGLFLLYIITKYF